MEKEMPILIYVFIQHTNNKTGIDDTTGLVLLMSSVVYYVVYI